MISLCLGRIQDDREQMETFRSGLLDILDGQVEAANQLFGRSNGGLQGNRIAQMTRSSNRGTNSWSEEPDGREADAPNRGGSPRRRRQAHDMALDSARQQRQQSGFLSRFPDAARIRYATDAY